MSKLIILAIFSFSSALFAKGPSNYIQLKTEINKISQSQLIGILNQFVKDSSPSRMIGTPGHEKAKEFIMNSIKAYDPKESGKIFATTFEPDVEEAQRFYQNDFDQKVEGKINQSHPNYQKWLRFTSSMKLAAKKYQIHKGTNIIWEKPGLNASKVLVVSAHYDTISHDPQTFLIAENAPMPGANYNASGVSVALALVKILAQLDLNYSVQVVFLDWQGIGFLGSHHYAQELKKTDKTILGFLNLEMLGQDTSYLDKTKKTGNMSVYFRPEDEKLIQNFDRHGKNINSQITFIMKPTGFDFSDNIRFWPVGFLGGTFSQNWEDDFNPKFYQTPLDTPETLNHQTLYWAYQYLGGAVLGTLLDLTK